MNCFRCSVPLFGSHFQSRAARWWRSAVSQTETGGDTAHTGKSGSMHEHAEPELEARLMHTESGWWEGTVSGDSELAGLRRESAGASAEGRENKLRARKTMLSQAGWQPVHRETYRSEEVKVRKHRSLFLTPKKRKTRSGLRTSPPMSWPCGRDEGLGK